MAKMLTNKHDMYSLVVDTVFRIRNVDKPFETYLSEEFIFSCDQKDRFELVILAVDRPDVGCWAMMPCVVAAMKVLLFSCRVSQ
jgi:hypothetical protein